MDPVGRWPLAAAYDVADAAAAVAGDVPLKRVPFLSQPLLPPSAPRASPQQHAAAGLARPWWGFLLTRRNLAQSAAALAVHAGAIALHTAATGFTLRRGVEVYGRGGGGVDAAALGAGPLRDVLHDALPNLQRWRVVPEVGHLVPVLALVWCLLSHIDQRSLDAFRLFLWCHAALMATRAASFASTLLPDASQQCHTSLFVGSCHDLMFSGHAMIMTLATLVLQHFFALPAGARRLLWASNAGVAVLIVATRNHYTVDVVAALALAAAVWGAFSRHPALLAVAVADPLHALLRGLPGGVAAAALRSSAACDCSGYADVAPQLDHHHDHDQRRPHYSSASSSGVSDATSGSESSTRLLSPASTEAASTPPAAGTPLPPADARPRCFVEVAAPADVVSCCAGALTALGRPAVLLLPALSSSSPSPCCHHHSAWEVAPGGEGVRHARARPRPASATGGAAAALRPGSAAVGPLTAPARHHHHHHHSSAVDGGWIATAPPPRAGCGGGGGGGLRAAAASAAVHAPADAADVAAATGDDDEPAEVVSSAAATPAHTPPTRTPRGSVVDGGDDDGSGGAAKG